MSVEEGSPEAEAEGGDAASPTLAVRSVGEDGPVKGLLVLGGLLIAAGAVSGFILMLQVAPAGCNDAYNTCSHPRTALGLVLIGASAFATVLLALLGIIARRVVEALPPRREQPSP